VGQERYGTWAAGLDRTTVAEAMLAFGIAWFAWIVRGVPAVRPEPPQPASVGSWTHQEAL
jgi:hypothetical protein